MAKILSIIAGKGFQDQEYNDSKAVLEKNGHQVITASSKKNAIGKFGALITADILINDIKPEDYDALALIGGPGCYEYFNDKHIHEIARAFYEAGKPTCAICAAPSILANAGLLSDKKATAYEGESQNLKSKRAIYTDEKTTQDGNIITGNGPDAATAFGELISKALGNL